MNATLPATSAATIFGAAGSNAPPGAATTAGNTSAVSMAAGTYRNARPSSGGTCLRAKKTMNDSRDR